MLKLWKFCILGLSKIIRELKEIGEGLPVDTSIFQCSRFVDAE